MRVNNDQQKKIKRKKSNSLFRSPLGDMKVQSPMSHLFNDGAHAVQAKLEINAPGDEYEQLADIIARQIVSGGDVSAEMMSHTSPMQRKEESEEDTPQLSSAVMMKSEGGGMHGTGELQRTLDSTKGSGQALDDATKTEMGSKMGADLSDVKVHTGSKANEMSEGINAKAFTYGQDIYFKDGNYNPQSNEGKELLAHELVHTQQQKGGIGRKVQRQEDLTLQQLRGIYDSRLVYGIAEEYKTVASFPGKGIVQVAANTVHLQTTSNPMEPKKQPVDGPLPVELKLPGQYVNYHRQVKILPTEGGELYITIAGTTSIAAVYDDLEKLSPFDLLTVSGLCNLSYNIKGTNAKGENYYTEGMYDASHSSLLALIRGTGEPLDTLLNYTALDEKFVDKVLAYVKGLGSFTAVVNDTEDVEFMQGRKGDVVLKPAIAAQQAFRIKYTPVPRNKNIDLKKLSYKDELFFNEPVMVTRQYNGWYFITTLDGRHGWVESWALAFDPPEPSAKLYMVEGADTLWKVVSGYYMLKDEEDKRLYVNAVVYANRKAERNKGIQDTGTPSFWEADDLYHRNPQLQKGAAIWMPSPEFIQALKKSGAISSGSFTEEMWNKISGFAVAVWDVIKFIGGFIGGLVYGFVEAIYDAIAAIIGLVKGIVEFIIALFTKEFYEKAAELWETVKNLSKEDIKKIMNEMAADVLSGIIDFESKWDAKDALEKGFFVGRVIGYIIAEIVMAILTAGILTEVKWVSVALSKMGKAGKIILNIINKFRTVIKKDKRLDDLQKELNRIKKHREVARLKKKFKGAKGLIGKQYEDFLRKVLNGEGSFKMRGREFDGKYNTGKNWYEAKSGRYWKDHASTPQDIAKFKSDMGDRLRIAKSNGAIYELFSNTPIPNDIRKWLINKGINFTETLD